MSMTFFLTATTLFLLVPLSFSIFLPPIPTRLFLSIQILGISYEMMILRTEKWALRFVSIALAYEGTIQNCKVMPFCPVYTLCRFE
jgi:hypothetical protein